MNCTELQNQIQEMSPEESRFADSEWWEHLVFCSACRELWESQSVVLEATDVWKQQVIPEVDITDRVLLQLQQETLSKHPTAKLDREKLFRF